MVDKVYWYYKIPIYCLKIVLIINLKRLAIYDK